MHTAGGLQSNEDSIVVGRPGGLVVILKYYWRWSLSSIPTVVRFWLYSQNAKKGSTAESAEQRG